jgi:tetratricopeptide (TPR) repeat protein
MIRRALLALVLAVAVPAQARDIDHVTEYLACLDLVRDLPQKAYDAAKNWYAAGGDDAARHCAALALLRLGDFEPAARALQDLAVRGQRVGRTPPATLWGQAADAWRLAGKPEQAIDLMRLALARDSDSLALRTELARVLSEAGRNDEALAELDKIFAKRLYDPTALAVKAGVLYRTGRPLDALRALDQSLLMEPANAWALLERARIKRAGKDFIGARKDFTELAETFATLPVAAIARTALAEIKATGR